jgi:hypothetical protein
VRRTNVLSAQYQWPDFVTRSSKITDDIPKDRSEDARDVFKQTPTGSKQSNKPNALWPKVAVIVFSFAFAGDGVWLARKPATQ